MTTHLGSWMIYSRRKRQKKKALRRGAEQKANYIIPRRKGSVKILAGYTLSDGQLRRRPLGGDEW